MKQNETRTQAPAWPAPLTPAPLTLASSQADIALQIASALALAPPGGSPALRELAASIARDGARLILTRLDLPVERHLAALTVEILVMAEMLEGVIRTRCGELS